MTPEQWLSKQIKEKGIKQRFIVENTGIPDFTEQRLSLSLTGRRGIKVDEFVAVCRVIGVNPLDCPIPGKEGEANA